MVSSRAQPVMAAHYWLAYCEKFQRDRERLSDCLKRVNVLPLGAAALAGTSLPIDRQESAKLLSKMAERNWSRNLRFRLGVGRLGLLKKVGLRAELYCLESGDLDLNILNLLRRREKRGLSVPLRPPPSPCLFAFLIS